MVVNKYYGMGPEQGRRMVPMYYHLGASVAPSVFESGYLAESTFPPACVAIDDWSEYYGMEPVKADAGQTNRVDWQAGIVLASGDRQLCAQI